MEINQLEALRTIVETGSFSEAASRLRLTQPALSHKIRNLEDELGETLLIRARPRVYPSPAGELVLSSAERILSEIDTVREHFPAQRRGPIGGTIRVAATTAGVVYLFGDLCEAFIKRFPKIELIFRATETADEATRRVLAGAADVAFGPLPVDHAQLSVLELGTMEHVFIVGRGHPLDRSNPVSLQEIRRVPFIRFETGSGSRALSDPVFAAAGGYPPIVAESNDFEFVKRLVAMNLGVAMVPAFVLRYQPVSLKLRVLRFSGEPLPTVTFGLFYRANLRRRSIDSLVTLCQEVSGGAPRRVTAQNARVSPFGTL